MKTKWLFPNRFRFIGWLLFIPSAIIGLPYTTIAFMIDGQALRQMLARNSQVIDDLYSNALTDEVAAICAIAGLLLIAFSREKVEDEMIGQLRLEALQWSVYANYLILAIAILTIYDSAFLNVMIYNMFTVLLVFIIRFRWLIHRNNNTLLAL